MEFLAAPKPIALSPEEEVLERRIDGDSSGQAAADLARSLLGRDAVPGMRIRYFIDPELNVGGRSWSREQVFRRAGLDLEGILRHAHFRPILRYFINGPVLPAATIDQFAQVVIDDAGTNGEVLDQLRRFARAEARRLSDGRRTKLHEEFFKLALESS